MVGKTRVTRRQMLGATAGIGLLGGRGALAAPALVKGSKLTFWGGLIFSDKANKLLAETVRKWGADNGIQAEVVMINQNETVQKVSAAVASNTMPDALQAILVATDRTLAAHASAHEKHLGVSPAELGVA